MVPRRIGLALAAGAVLAVSLDAAPTPRAVYVTAVDNQGRAVTDLTAADFALKEGGRDREISSVERATALMHVSVAFEETLTPLGGLRQGIVDFAKAMAPLAEMELVIVGQSNRVAQAYTSDVDALVTAVNALPLSQRSSATNHVPEGIGDLARGFIKTKRERPVVVMVALSTPQVSAEQPQNILNMIKDSGAQMHVVWVEVGGASLDAGTNMELAGKAQVLGDGPKQSGGRQIAVNALTAIPRAMQQVAADLSSQYKISYVLPDGVRPSDRLSVDMKRRGVTLRAPSRISDK